MPKIDDEANLVRATGKGKHTEPAEWNEFNLLPGSTHDKYILLELLARTRELREDLTRIEDILIAASKPSKK
jgi:hypothetical protein